MALKQVCVFIENKKGKISEVSILLYSNGIDLRGLNMSEAKEFAILRLITQDTTKACEVLKGARYVFSVNEVIAVRMVDEPGSMCNVLRILSDEKVGIEYTYLIRNFDGEPYMVLRTDSEKQAEELLKNAGVELLSYE